MTPIRALSLAFLLTGLLATAQVTPTRPTPDCDKSYSGATTGTTTTYDNSDTQCVYWQVLTDVFNAAPVISATFQHAPWNSGGTGAGTFATFGGLTAYGSNPCVTENCLSTFIGYYPFLRVNITSLTGTYRIRLLGWRNFQPTLSAVNPNTKPLFFGSGEDGNFTCNSSSHSSGPLTSGVLTRDAFYNNLTIASGCAIKTASFRVYVLGTLDLSDAPTGAFASTATSFNGGNASAGTAGSASGVLNGVSMNGTSLAGAGGAGTTGAGATGQLGTPGMNGGASGASGAGGTGASAGASGRSANAVTYRVFSRFDANVLVGTAYITSGSSGPAGASGGGSGAAAGGGGGAGGSSPGPAWFSAFTVLRSSTTAAGVFTYAGGSGGNGGNGSGGVNAGGGGGGGGAGGGFVILYYAYLTGTASSNAVFDVSGGTGGNGGSGSGTGTAGVAGGGGSCGRVIKYNLLTNTITNTLGTTGTAGSGTTGGSGCTASGAGFDL